jgi:nucleoside-diphosphate-sugar epimerase
LHVLVTGAAGFIGSHLVRSLLDVGHTVRAVDDLSTGNLRRLMPVLDRIEWVEGSVCDVDICHHVLEKVDVVLHQAAIPSVARSLADPVATNEANVTGTLTLLQACRDRGVKRLVMAASSSAYGDSASLPKVETMCPAPLSPYAVSKLVGEQYCQVFARLGYVETVCLRYFNVFGPGQDPTSQYAAVIPKFITSMLEGVPVPINGDGKQSRDFTYISNVVHANMLAMTAPDASGQALNIACGERHDLLSLASEVASLLSVTPDIVFGPSRPGDVPHSLADIGRARMLLGYEPTVLFRDGLKMTVEWYVAQHRRKAPVEDRQTVDTTRHGSLS